MPRWYNRATCAVFPSLSEAYGLTCAEAMACGTPVVMTSRASGPELVEDGVTGFLREPTDRQSLAEAIITLLRNPVLRDTISLNALEQVNKKFEAGKIFEENISVYERLIRHGRG
jgi:glycosyltransferase involved in cell wall biosynthesis